MKKMLSQIVSFAKYHDIFKQINQIDKTHGEEIIKGLEDATRETHIEIMEAEGNYELLKYWLYKESIEIKAHTNSYLTRSEAIANIEAKLLKRALTISDDFFRDIFNNLDKYFYNKKQILLEEIENSFSWYSNITDSSKKILEPVNNVKKLFKSKQKDIESVRKRLMSPFKNGASVEKKKSFDNQLNSYDKKIIDTKSITESLLEKHFNSDQLVSDISEILKKAHQNFKNEWFKEVSSQSPNINILNFLSGQTSNSINSKMNFELGSAEQTFAVGMTGAFVGTISLAAGWHTLTYAMLNVFPPVAIFSVIATLSVAVFTKDKALEKKKKQLIETIDQYHQNFILQLGTANIDELDGKTLREAINQQSQKIVNETISNWEKQLYGNLTSEHYEILIKATSEHLMLVQECLDVKIAAAENGRIFENYIVNKFDEKFYRIKEWRSDKYYKGRFAESTLYPDLKIESVVNGKVFSVECKWRKKFYNNGIQWTNEKQKQRYIDYSQFKNIPVYIILGVGGKPNNPDELFAIPLKKIEKIFLTRNELKHFKKNVSTDSTFKPF